MCSGDTMKVFFHTLGCKVNQYETQEMREQLKKNGYEITEDENIADIFVINSCTVTSESDRKTRQCVRHYKKKYPESTVVLTGCMPQSFPEMAEKLTEADIVLGNKNNKLLASSLDEYFGECCRVLHLEQHQSGESLVSSGISGFDERTRATLTNLLTYKETSSHERRCNKECRESAENTASGTSIRASGLFFR